MKDIITVIILAKNEADVIGDAIRSAKKLTDTVLVIDALSIDETPQIAEKLHAKVIKHQFKDFSDQRNFAILHASTPWVLYLDADERLTDAFVREVESAIKNYENDMQYGAFFIKRKTFYFGKDWGFEDQMQRLFVRDRFVEWKGVVHETPVIKGQFGVIESPILHYTHRNLSQMVAKTNEWSDYEAQLRLKVSHPAMKPWRFFRVMMSEFYRSYIKDKGYKNGTYGLVEGMYQAFSIFITYAKLWELQQKK